jgi:sphingolipid 8-(E)-desaturase
MCTTTTVSNTNPPHRPVVLLSRQQIQKRVNDGETLVIIHNKVYNLTKWLLFHPGGELAIKHMAGMDC